MDVLDEHTIVTGGKVSAKGRPIQRRACQLFANNVVCILETSAPSAEQDSLITRAVATTYVYIYAEAKRRCTYVQKQNATSGHMPLPSSSAQPGKVLVPAYRPDACNQPACVPATFVLAPAPSNAALCCWCNQLWGNSVRNLAHSGCEGCLCTCSLHSASCEQNCCCQLAGEG
jgi:hypothetical protein